MLATPEGAAIFLPVLRLLLPLPFSVKKHWMVGEKTLRTSHFPSQVV